MDKAAFVEVMINSIHQMQGYINEMPYKGDKCEDSQKVCLQNILNDLGKNLIGLEDEDFEELEEYDEGESSGIFSDDWYNKADEEYERRKEDED